jgi:hypothetical protein
VWQLLRRRIDEVLEGVRLSDLLAEEGVVRERIGLPEQVVAVEDERPGALPVLQG